MSAGARPLRECAPVAKKTPTKKSPRKAPASKKAGARAGSKKTAKTAKKAPAKKAASKKTAKKPVTKKKTTKKPAAKKAPSKKTVKKTVKKAPAKKPATKKTTSKKAPAKKAPAKQATTKKAPAKATESGADKKKGPKGITIVNKKPMRKAKVKKVIEMPRAEPLLKPGKKWKPLIPSGPSASKSSGASGTDDASGSRKTKMTKRQLDKFKRILLDKRNELIGDISNMEEEALRQSSGSLSHLPQHMADSGSESFDQSLSLDLAAVDRTLLKEIDDAIARIADRTYGVCELTGKPINPERLVELPWARYSIEAARDLERRRFGND